MPISPLGATLIGAGADIVGSLSGGLFGQNQSKKAWREQAEYNSPANQMKRLKLAGLNPNLVYGNGSVQNTQSNTYDTAKPDASKVGSEGLQNYTAQRMFNLQNDLIEKQKEFIDTQIADKQSMINYRDTAQTEKTIADTIYTNLSGDFRKKTLDAFDIDKGLEREFKRSQIDSTNTQTSFAKLQMSMYPKEVQARLSETYKRIEKMGFEIDNIKANTSLLRDEKAMKFLRIEEQKLFNDLRKEGINPNDNFLWRQLRQLGKWFDDKTNVNTW